MEDLVKSVLKTKIYHWQRLHYHVAFDLTNTSLRILGIYNDTIPLILNILPWSSLVLSLSVPRRKHLFIYKIHEVLFDNFKKI